jgi:P27 family predicted phage terminase small subunit
MRGPKPKPTAVLKLRGARGLSRRALEPQPRLGRPEPPAWITGDGLTEWHRVCDEMEAMGTLATADLAVLAAYARAWQDLCTAARELDRRPLTETTSNGNTVISPMLGAKNRATDLLIKLVQQLGLSPSSRARVQGGKSETQKSKGRFFGGASGA